MKSNLLFSIVCALFVWILGVSIYLLSYYFPVIEDPELQANGLLLMGIIPSAWLGTYLFYRKGSMAPSVLALIYIIIAALLDAIITVPQFIIPYGGTYSEFFCDPKFYVIVVVYYLTVFFSGNHLSKNIKA